MPTGPALTNIDTPPTLQGTLPATGMRPSGWGAFWLGVFLLCMGIGLVRCTRRPS